MKFFLKVRAWQLFFMIFAVPLMSQFIVMRVATIRETPEIAFFFVPIVMLAFVACILGWFWTVGGELNKMAPQGIRMNPRFFKFCVSYSAIYAVFFMAYFVLTTAGNLRPGRLGFLLVPFHGFAMYSMLYSLYFVSKNLVMVEKYQSIGFADFLGCLLLIWFYPMGIWFIQPRINQLFAQEQRGTTGRD